MSKSSKSIDPSSNSSRLLVAAMTASTILAKQDIPHAFLGGFVMNLLDKERYAGSVDLEIKKPTSTSWNEIAELFEETGRYEVKMGDEKDIATEKDAFTKRVQMTLNHVKIDVKIYVIGRRPWKSPSIETIDGLPVHSTTDLFISKVKCCGKRHHLADAMDVIILYNSHKASIDEMVVRKTLQTRHGVQAMRKHPNNPNLFVVMQELGLLPFIYRHHTLEHGGRQWLCL